MVAGSISVDDIDNCVGTCIEKARLVFDANSLDFLDDSIFVHC